LVGDDDLGVLDLHLQRRLRRAHTRPLGRKVRGLAADHLIDLHTHIVEHLAPALDRVLFVLARDLRRLSNAVLATVRAQVSSEVITLQLHGVAGGRDDGREAVDDLDGLGDAVLEKEMVDQRQQQLGRRRAEVGQQVLKGWNVGKGESGVRDVCLTD
jgi:hypothetical protein